MIKDVRAALLGDHEAAKRLTEAGVMLPCPWCGETPKVHFSEKKNCLPRLILNVVVGLEREFLEMLSAPLGSGTPAHRF